MQNQENITGQEKMNLTMVTPFLALLLLKKRRSSERQQKIENMNAFWRRGKKTLLKEKAEEMEMKEAMDTPINPLPERELCEYEKLRQNNIEERQMAMAECGFFEDLMNIKRDIGLAKD